MNSLQCMGNDKMPLLKVQNDLDIAPTFNEG